MKTKSRITFAYLPVNAIGERQILQPEFLSFTIDTSLVIGGHWWGESRNMDNGVASDVTGRLDLGTDRLVRLAKTLSPAMLRIGGTEADRLFYKTEKKTTIEQCYASENSQNPHPYEYILKKGLWKKIHTFTASVGMSLLFTISAGLANRDKYGVWQEDNAAKLIAWSKKKKLRVGAWEFGNEVNGFPFIYGWKFRVSSAQYARDFARFGNLVRTLTPGSKIVGPASSVWPKIGEPNPIIPKLCKSTAAVFLDVLSWHWYPQQSCRGKVATRRAGLFTLLSSRRADSVLRFITRFTKYLNMAKQTRSVYGMCEQWITETGHALYGGEPGVSDTFASTLWWLDALALFAQSGISRVFRQSLIGSDYGLLDQQTIEPRPDFYASFLWKKIMGERVLDFSTVECKPAGLRMYVHASRDGLTFSVLVVNFSKVKKQTFRLVAEVGTACNLESRYLLTGHEGVHSGTLLVNGIIADESLVFEWKLKKTNVRYRSTSFSEAEKRLLFRMPPHSAMFVVLYSLLRE